MQQKCLNPNHKNISAGFDTSVTPEQCVSADLCALSFIRHIHWHLSSLWPSPPLTDGSKSFERQTQIYIFTSVFLHAEHPDWILGKDKPSSYRVEETRFKRSNEFLCLRWPRRKNNSADSRTPQGQTETCKPLVVCSLGSLRQMTGKSGGRQESVWCGRFSESRLSVVSWAHTD